MALCVPRQQLALFATEGVVVDDHANVRRSFGPVHVVQTNAPSFSFLLQPTPCAFPSTAVPAAKRRGQAAGSTLTRCAISASRARASQALTAPVPQALKPFSLEQRCKCGPEGKPKVRSTLRACDAQTGSC